MWKSRFVFKDLLVDGDVEAEKVREINKHMLIRLKGTTSFTPASQRRLVEVFAGVQDQDSFNGALEELYDAADAERVWLGFRP